MQDEEAVDVMFVTPHEQPIFIPDDDGNDVKARIEGGVYHACVAA